MKKILIFILLFLCYNLYSQDSEPTPYDLIWGGSHTPRPMVVDSFNIDGIKLGFQWSGSPKMSSALLHNIVHGGTPVSVHPEVFDDGTYVIGQPTIYGMNNMAMIQYEPTLITNDYRDFTTRPYDNTNAIFRFSNGLSIISNAYSTLSNSLSTNGNGIQRSGKASRSGGCAIRKDGTIKKKTNKSISTLDFYLSTNWRVIQ